MEKPSYCIDIPADEYHQATKDNKFTSSHRLNLFRKCPALYIKHVTGEIVEGDTEAFMLGRATHTHVLEGHEKFYLDYTVAIGPVNPKTGKPFGRMTKAYKDWAAAQEKPIVNVEDFKTIAKMSEAVRVAVYQISQATLDDLIYSPVTKYGPGLYPTLAELNNCRVTDTWPTRYENFGII